MSGSGIEDDSPHEDRSQSLPISGLLFPITGKMTVSSPMNVAIPSYLRAIVPLLENKSNRENIWLVAIPSYLRAILPGMGSLVIYEKNLVILYISQGPRGPKTKSPEKGQKGEKNEKRK